MYRSMETSMRRMSRSFAAKRKEDLESVWFALKEALDGANQIHASASLAYQETDPAARVPLSELVLRYQKFALKDLTSALERYQSLDQRDLERCEEETQNQLKVTAADTMLAVDKLSAAISKGSDDEEQE